MSTNHEVIDSYKRITRLGGKEVEVLVVIKAGPEEYTDPEGDFDFGNDEENREYLAKFHSGELLMSNIQVEVHFAGLVGSASLGACHLRTSHIGEDVNQIVDEYGMLDEVISDLDAQITNIVEKFK